MSHKYSIKDLPNSRKQLTITAISEEALKDAENKALDEFSKQMKVKGFREGKVPKDVVRERVGEEFLKAQSLQNAIPVVANGIVAEEKLEVIGQPTIDIKSVEPLEIVVEFDVYPKVSVGNYSKIKVKVKKTEATDKEVNEVVETFQKRMAEFEEVDRAAKMEDRAEIDFHGTDKDGKDIEGASSTNYPIVLGSNMLIPGFEEEIVGMKKGEEKSFDINFPKDYHSEALKGAKVTFKIKLHKVEEVKLPELNEETIEKASGTKQSVDEWKKSLKEQIQKEHDQEVKKQVEEQYFTELVKVVKMDIPVSMIDSEKQSILKDLKRQILQQGLSYEKYLETLGKDEQGLLDSYDEQAQSRIKLQFGLKEIRDMEKIETSDADVEAHIQKLVEPYPEEQRKAIAEQYKTGSEAFAMMKHQLGIQKTLEKILPEV